MADERMDKLEEVLRKLSEDDDFRAKFEADPAGELKAHGVDVDPDRLPSDPTLPSKDEIKRTFHERAEEARRNHGCLTPMPIWPEPK